VRELRNISREQLAKKSKVKCAVLARIEEGTIDGGDFGLEEICKLAGGMGITPYRLMLAPRIPSEIHKTAEIDRGDSWRISSGREFLGQSRGE
jgi:transcriptional regulator with XRE-family HTH domain